MRIRGSWMALLIAFVAAGLVLATSLQSSYATPAPVPITICAPNDLLQVNSFTADPWPPKGDLLPLTGTATIEDGKLTSLRLDLHLGTDWVFQSVGPLDAVVTPGFVWLNWSSVSWDVIAPPLPLPAGPYDATGSFGSPPTTIVSGTTLTAPVSALTAKIAVTLNEIPGFPTVPGLGGKFVMHVELKEPGGQWVLCFDLSDITCTDPSICWNAIQTVSATPAPAMSTPAFLLGALLLTGVGVLALARRRIRSSRERFR